MVQIELAISLEYGIEDPGGADFIFNIHPARTAHQKVQAERLELTGDVPRDIATDTATATRFMRLHAEPGVFVLRYHATVAIQHHLAEPDTLIEVPVRCLPLEVMPYLYPSRYCESDRLLKLAWAEFGTLWPGYNRVLAIQHWVQQRVTYASGSSSASTSALDTIVDRVGVCRDYAHLMVALCRALNIPARVATGTDYGANPLRSPPDFHAYVEVYLSDRWYLFDPSGIGIPMGFMRFGTGRDAADVAFATIFGNVTSKAPWLTVSATQGAGSVLPDQHCPQALCTTAPLAPNDLGCTSFGARSERRQMARQLPE
jgi:transglutaminase-like putative cysteine protease